MEIDDIFAGKPSSSKVKLDTPVPKTSKPKSQKRKRQAQESTADEKLDSSKKPKRPPPEEIIDTSAALEALSSSSKPTTSRPEKQVKGSKQSKDAAFSDSRGTSSREYHFVSPVFLLYELQGEQLKRDGPYIRRMNWALTQTKAEVSAVSLLFHHLLIIIFQDTPDCPFDCECCMSFQCWLVRATH